MIRFEPLTDVMNNIADYLSRRPVGDDETDVEDTKQKEQDCQEEDLIRFEPLGGVIQGIKKKNNVVDDKCVVKSELTDDVLKQVVTTHMSELEDLLFEEQKVFLDENLSCFSFELNDWNVKFCKII